jgi:hypothetical protein
MAIRTLCFGGDGISLDSFERKGRDGEGLIGKVGKSGGGGEADVQVFGEEDSEEVD